MFVRYQTCHKSCREAILQIARNSAETLQPLRARRRSIDDERMTLMRAYNLLSCLSIAVQHMRDEKRPPYIPDIVDTAQDIVNAVINRLEAHI